MDLTSRSVIQEILKRHDAPPIKYLGQNFLISRPVLETITSAADLQPGDIALEIGPGLGTLTIELARKAKRVIAVEKDERMVGILKETLEGFKNVDVIRGDILRLQITNYKLPSTNSYKLVANLPYYIASPTIRKFLESAKVRPKLMVLMVQKEVAQRICAKPPEMSILAVFVQFYGEPKIVEYVPKTSFWPTPHVDSAIIKIIPKEPATRPGLVDLFSKVVKAGFSHPRKQLVNNLSDGLKLDKEKTRSWLSKNKIDPTQRAETLTVEDWVHLTKTLKT